MNCEHCHHEPTYQAIEQAQQPYRDLWQAMIERIAALSPDMPVYQRDLSRWAIELWGEQPDAQKAFELRTTRYGRDDTD